MNSSAAARVVKGAVSGHKVTWYTVAPFFVVRSTTASKASSSESDDGRTTAADIATAAADARLAGEVVEALL